MTIKGVDTTDRSLTGATLKADGYGFACRYIRNAPVGTLDKEWTRAEVAEKSAHGVRVVANFEWAERPTNSKATGRSHANIFLDELASVGGPSWAPCYFSADYPAHAHDLDLYFEGVADVLTPQRTGAYTNGTLYRQLKADGLITLAWQSMSKSYPGNSSTAGADIVQTNSGHIGGHSCDFNTAKSAYYGGWLLGEANPNAPKPTPEVDVELTDPIKFINQPDVKYSGPQTTVGGILASTNYYVLQTRNQVNAKLTQIIDLLGDSAKVEAAIAAALTTLPTGVQVTAAELQAALLGALKQLAGADETPAS